MGIKRWITIRGIHIPIHDEENTKQAIRKKFKPTKPKPKSEEEILEDIRAYSKKPENGKYYEEAKKVLNMYDKSIFKESQIPKENLVTFTKMVYKPASRERCFRGKCHYISTAYANEYGDELWTGFMVSKDGSALRHSWNVKNGIVIERTPVKDTPMYSQVVKYVGKRVK